MFRENQREVKHISALSLTRGAWYHAPCLLTGCVWEDQTGEVGKAEVRQVLFEAMLKMMR